MIEQEYFVDHNTIELQKALRLFGIKFSGSHVIANGLPPHQEEEFVMLPTTYDESETVRKLISLRSRSKQSFCLGETGEDFILGPNIDRSHTEKSGNIVWGDPSQLRVWVRDTLRNNK